MAEFRMPSLGADMEAGTLVQWLVKPGDRVKRGDIIAVVETQKGAIEIESFETGTVAELTVPEGARVPVGTVLAVIGAVDAPAPSAAPPAPSAARPAPAPAAPMPTVAPPPPPRAAAPPPPAAAPPPPPPAAAAPVPTVAPPVNPWPVGHTWVRSSPAARARAHALGVDLSTVKGTGPHGAVTRADVERVSGAAAVAPSRPPSLPPAAPPAPPASATPAAPSPAQAMRNAIAAAMARSNREIPHYHLGHHVDLHHALTALAAFNAPRPVEERVLPAALLLHAIARCVPRHPELNGVWTDLGFAPAPAVHLGVAVSLRGGGLVVPALHDADQLDLAGVMAGLRDLVARARAGRLRSSDLADGTLTVTNLGDQGTETVHGVIYPGQAALVGVGRVLDRPWAVDGMLAIRPVVHVSLAGDHRASDGHRGALFLAAVDRFLQEVQLP